MSKITQRKKIKAGKIAPKKKNRQPHLKGLKAYECSSICGCCTNIMYFRNDEAINTAFAKAGYDCGATIVDDAGIVHKDVDTFYGASRAKDKIQSKKGLTYLFNKAFK